MTPDEYNQLLKASKNKSNKYGAKRAKVDGITFASKAEAKRYGDLMNLQRGKQISGLETHPKYSINIDGHHICVVELDFRYLDLITGKVVVEDVKGKDNALSKLKRKLVTACHSIEVVIISF